MPITVKQRARRRNHLGSSDVAALFGLDPYRSAYDIWLEKTGKLHDEDDDGGVKHLGNVLEPSVLDWASSELGTLRRNQYRSHPTLPLGCNIDAIVVKENAPVDAKTSGLEGPIPGRWGEPGSDEVPEHIVIQVHAHMLAMTPVHASVAYVPALLGGRGLQMYRVARNDRIIDAIAETAERFWTHHVQADIEPAGVPHLSVARMMRRTPGKVVCIQPEIVERWMAARDAARDAARVAEAAEAELLSTMGDADAAEADGFGAVTYYEQTRREYTVGESTYRVLRYRKKGLDTK